MKQNRLLVLLAHLALPAVGPDRSAASDQAPAAGLHDAQTSLAGQWRFKLAPRGEGINGQWFRTSLPDQIALLGSCQQAGFGTEAVTASVGRLTPADKFDGLAWYQRDIDVPPAWQGKRLEMFLERCLWESRAWLDNRPLGTQNSLSTPHVYDLGSVSPGRHVLTVCVDNRYKLRATDPVNVYNLQVDPDMERSVAKVRGQLGNATGRDGAGSLRTLLSLEGTARREAKVQTTSVHWTPKGGSFGVKIPMGDAGVPAQPWDEFTPRLYRMEAALAGSAFLAAATFGWHRLVIQDRQITLNGRPALPRQEATANPAPFS